MKKSAKMDGITIFSIMWRTVIPSGPGVTGCSVVVLVVVVGCVVVVGGISVVVV